MDQHGPAVTAGLEGAPAASPRVRLSGYAATAVLLGVPLLFLGVFAVYPLVGMLRVSFFREGWDADALKPLTADGYYVGRLWFSAWQAALSTAITLTIALPCAYVLARFEFRGKSLLTSLATVPFVLPTIVVAVAFVALIGPRGVINDLLQSVFRLDEPPIRVMNTLWAILIAHVFYNFAVAARIIAAYWANLDTRIADAAATLGAGRLETFWRVTLPLLRPPILAAGSLVYLFCFSSFGVILVLGGPEFYTLEAVIYQETTSLFRLPVAGTLALIQLVFSYAVMTVYTRAQGRPLSSGFQPPRRARLTRGERAAIVATFAFTLTATLAPLLALTERSVHGSQGYTLEFYRSLSDNVRNQALFIAPTDAIVNSLRFAAVTLAIALPLGVCAAYAAERLRRGGAFVEALFLLPLGISAVTLALGFLITFDEPPLNLRGNWLIIPIAHSLVAYPFVARTVSAQLRGMDPRMREAARTLGAGPLQVFLEVDLPLIWRSIVVGGVFAFAISVGEFGVSLLLTRADWATVPTAIYRLTGTPGELQYGEALAMSTILMGITAAGFLVLERLRFRDLGAF